MKVITGDSLEKLKSLEASSVDAVVTDPPYGLSFMGKKWDYDVPSVDLWKEVFRVLKPGGHVLSFGGTRTYHRLVVAIEDAGFEIRDQIQWLYGSGFPKSHNLKDEWQGWGTALKPANEPICVARKPLEKGLTVAQNVFKYGTGAINIDESRIASEPVPCQVSSTGSGFNKYDSTDYPGKRVYQTQGRWPANVLLDEDAAQVLDEQSGFSKSGGGKSSGKTFHGQKYIKAHNERPTDAGGASRFFYVAKASKRERNAGLEEMPTKQPAQKYGMGAVEGNPRKPAKCTANEPVQNFHPTVKPIKLMEYLIKLVTPKGGTVLDPFMGSGSTGVAAKNLGFKFIGIELNPEYAEIAKRRIRHELPVERQHD